jgi:hypothetical protein
MKKNEIFRHIYWVIILFALPLYSISQHVQTTTGLEYFYDTDPGVGLGTAISGPSSTASITIPNTLTEGFHILYYRGKGTLISTYPNNFTLPLTTTTSASVNTYGLTESRSFYVLSSVAATPTINAYEYFIDTDPGVGLATAFTGTSLTLPTTLTEGFHTIYFRARYDNGQWGLTEQKPFYIQNTVASTTPTINAKEYFLDIDPGVGLATAFTGTSLSLPNTITEGFHTIYFRARYDNGQWGLTESKPFYVLSTAAGTPPTINAKEYFIDTDPGVGMAVAFTGTSLALPTTLTDGIHTIYFRARYDNGQWGLTESRPFYVLNTVAGTPPTINAKEYFIDTDPGVGMAVSFTGTSLALPTTLTDGIHTIYFRARYDNGQWGLTESRPFYINPLDLTPVFSINAAEYFFDTDPGVGLGTTIPITPASTLTLNAQAIAMQSCLTPGAHIFYMRVRSAEGKWSLHEQKTITIERNDIQVLSAAITNNIPTGFPCNPSANEIVTVTIKNNGVTANTGVQTIFPGMVSVQLSVTGANTGTYTLTNTTSIALNGTEVLTFNTVNLTNRGNNTIVVSATICQDAVTTNNTLTINPNTNPLLTVNITSTPSSFSVCNGNNVTLIAAAAGGNATYGYKWDNTGTYNVTNATKIYNNPIGTTSHNVSVQDGIGCLASLNQNVTIYPLPTATIAGNINLCKGSTNPSITFTGAVGTAPFTFNYNINGGATQSITTTSGNTVTLNHPTNVSGTFVYNLLSIQDIFTCTQNQTGIATVTVHPLPTATISGTTAVCQNTTSPTITFTGAVGLAPYTFSYKLNGGTTQTISTIGTNSAITLTQSTSTVGTFSYDLISVTDSRTCLSDAITGQTAIITVISLPLATIIGNNTVCQNTPAPTVLFTGSNGATAYTFSYNINGNPTQTVTTAGVLNAVTVSQSTSNAGLFTYTLLSVLDGNGCSKNQPNSIQININPQPNASISSNINESCQFDILGPNLTFTGSGGTPPYEFTYKINNGTNQTISSSSSSSSIATITQSTNTPGSYTYEIVSIKDVNNCDKILTGITKTLIINALPNAPISGGNITECAMSTIQTITATASTTSGTTVEWYNAATGGSVITSPTLNSVGTVTYYAASKNNTTSCYSLTRTAVVLTIYALPSTPTSGGNITQCALSTIQTITATATATSGSTVEWYNAATGGSVITSPILNSIGTITYYAASKNNTTNCYSLIRTAVVLTINALPNAPTSGGNITECALSTIQTITATASTTSGSSVEWYDAATGGSVISTPTLNSVGTVTYYAASKNNTTSCYSLTRTAVVLTINALPSAPTSGGNITQCALSTIQTITASATTTSGSTVEWYNAATGGSLVTSPTLNSIGTITYYAASKNNTTNCYSLTRTAVVLTINALPNAPTSGGNITECAMSTIQTITALANTTSGSTVEWYDAATGGSIVTTPTLNSVGTVTYFAASKNNTTNCYSLTRTPVVLTINASPNAPTSGGNITECALSTIQTITASATTTSGSTVEWYNAAIGGSVVTSPTLNSIGTITYYAASKNNTTNCYSLTRTAIILTINALPNAPTSGGNITECAMSTIQTITALANTTSGSTVEWYDAATGGSVITSPTLNSVGTVTYYAASKNNTTSCNSLTRTAVVLTINALPSAPTSGGNITQCALSTIQTITATATTTSGSTVEWYNAAIGGSVVTSPTLNSIGTITYYAASKNNTTSCYSLTRTPVVLTINALPSAPTSGGNITECAMSTIQTITASATTTSGSTVEWYDAATGGSVVTSPTLNSIGTVTYYAASKNNTTSCYSLTRTPVVLTINALPNAPTSGGNITECALSTIQTITASATTTSGSTVEWYNAATGGSVVTSPTLNSIGTITYYAASKNNTTSCYSLTRTPVVLTINASPNAPTSGGNITECALSTIQTITALANTTSGSTVEWYDAATGGSVVTSPTLNSIGTVTYYAASKNNTTSCYSLTRTPVVLTINALPNAPTSGGNITECTLSTIQIITASATTTSGSTVEWYNVATGGSVVTSPTLNSIGTITYYAASKNNTTSCYSLTRTPVVLTINASPNAPTSGGNITECALSTIQTITALATTTSGSTVEWYDAATGGSVVTSPTLNSIGTVTYYAASKNNTTNCNSLTRTAVVLTINALPIAPTSGGNITECALSTIQTITASATTTSGSTVEWYTSATGGTVVTSPTLNSIGTVTYYAASKNNTTSCYSLTRTAVVLKINALPNAPTSGGNITECALSTIQTITASATTTSGSTVEWYDAATGGSVVTSPTLNSIGTVTYYAASKNNTTNCYSLTRTAVVLTINALPSAPTSGGNITECAMSTIQTITASATTTSGSTVEWYNAATGGSVVTSPILNSIGTITYYAATKNNTTSCYSLTRTAVVLTINALPITPISSGNITQCVMSPIQTITASASTASGSTIEWYDAATGGNIVINPTLSSIGTITYYGASKNTLTGCNSLTRTAVILTINALPIAPTSGGNITQCALSIVQTITAIVNPPSGSTVEWYNAATGGIIITSPTLSTIGTITYYAASKNTTTGCYSLARTAVILTINALPIAPTSGGNITQCALSIVQTITATATAPSGSTIEWYNASTGGSVVASPTLSSIGTLTYYAASKSNITGCYSLLRTAVVLTINALPIAPTSGGNVSQCATSPIQTITAVATAPSGSIVEWYNAATGGSVVTSPTLNSIGTITYYAASKNTSTGCYSLTRTAVVLTINASPTAVISGGATVCPGNPMPILTITLTGTSPWTLTYTNGTSPITVSGLVTSPYLFIPSTPGTYTVSHVSNSNCGSGITSGSATVVLNPLPNAGTITGASTVPCGGTTTLATSGDAGGTWSSSNTAIATVNATTGVVAAVSSGTVTITYTLTNACGSASATKVITIGGCAIPVNAKVYLSNIDSASSLMSTNLIAIDPGSASPFPLADPYFAGIYAASGNYAHLPNVITPATTTTILSSYNIVDWIFVELRTGTSGATTVAYAKAALLRNDGIILNSDGTPLSFAGASSTTEYFVAIKHRNHIGFMTASDTTFTITTPLLDLTSSLAPLYGSNPLRLAYPAAGANPAKYAMWAGDGNLSGDVDPIDLSNMYPLNGNIVDEYNPWDMDLDASVDTPDLLLVYPNNGNIIQQID